MFGQICGQTLVGPEDAVYSSTGMEKYSVQYYPDRENNILTIYYSTSKNTKLGSRYSTILFRDTSW